MKRKEQMMNAAEAYAAGAYADEPVSFSTEESLCETINDFCAGWRAADRCSQWIPVEERLPKHNVEDNGLITYKEVLVCLNDGYVTTDCYDDTRKKWLGYNGDVEYWMPTPQPPRKEARNV
jgi:hypothetical protein